MEFQILLQSKDRLSTQLLCQGNRQAQLICISPFCHKNAFCCGSENCSCKLNHMKCNMRYTQGIICKINRKRQKMSREVLQACDELRSIYNQLIDRLSKDREALTLWQDNYGISQLQYKFLEAIESGNYSGITGEKVFQITEGMVQQSQHEQFTKKWVTQKWQLLSSSFYGIFNELGKNFIGFNFGFQQFFPILPCFKTTKYGTQGQDFQFLSKKKGMSLTQFFAEGRQFINSIQVCFSDAKQRQVANFNQTNKRQGLNQSKKQQKMSELAWKVPKGQYISKIILNSGCWIDGISFITNQGTKSPNFGGKGGSVKTIEVPKGYRICGICGATGNYLRKFGLIFGKYLRKQRFYRYFKYDIHGNQEISKRVFIGRSYITKPI